MGEPNAAVRLFEGDGVLTDSRGTSSSGRVVVEMRWHPIPQVMFELRTRTASALETGRVELRIDGGGNGDRLVEGAITRVTRSMGGTTGFSEQAEGIIGLGPFVPSESVHSIEFDVPNFPRFLGEPISDPEGRVWLGGMRFRGATAGWRLTLDELHHVVQPNGLRVRLDSESGYGFTHVGRLERDDGAVIEATEASEVTTTVSRFLSFVAGADTRALLARGLDAEGDVVWERWDYRPTIAPWRPNRSAFPDHIISASGAVGIPDLSPIFDCLMARRDDPDWREIVELGIGWYVTANAHRSAETKTILAQAGLELAAWSELVPRVRTRSAFKDASAADNLTQLLLEYGIPTDIPSDLAALAVHGLPPKPWGGWADGPTALTQIRNSLVHPTKALKPLETPVDVRMQASGLAVWYLELILMYRFGYRDAYRSRVAPGSTVPVPWI